MKNILIISSSPRKKGNSQILCEQFKKGAEAERLPGHQQGRYSGQGSCGEFPDCPDQQDDDVHDAADDAVDRLHRALCIVPVLVCGRRCPYR